MPLACECRRSVNPFSMIQVLLYCSRNYVPKHSKRQQVRAKFPANPSSISCFRLRESSVAWVCALATSMTENAKSSSIGCHALALDLVRTWSFERPAAISRADAELPPSPQFSRRSLAVNPFLRRRSSILIDIDVDAHATSGQNSPKNAPQQAQAREGEPDRLARKAGLGSLIKSAKHDVQLPEFDINAFF